MAEGGSIQSPVRLKPVPPPKPTCTSPSTVKPPFHKTPDTSTRARVNALTTSYQEREEHEPRSPSNITNTASATITNSSGNRMSTGSSSQIARSPSVKPPLLPKPNLQNFQSCRKTEGSPSPLRLPRNSVPVSSAGNALKSPSKLFIPKARFSDVENGNSSGVSSGKAPVAKLEEFDQLCNQMGPIRPPRSPKNKNLFGGPFISELSKRQHLSDLRNKSASLNRSYSSVVELKQKSSSLGRGRFSDINQIWENDGSLFSREDGSPIRPPRRRNKSTTSPEVVSPESDQGFQFDVVQPPIYAQVNYSLKKNRRMEIQQESSSSAADSIQNDENEVSDNVDVEDVIKEVPFVLENESEPDLVKENCSTCDLNGEETKDNKSEMKEGNSEPKSACSDSGENVDVLGGNETGTSDVPVTQHKASDVPVDQIFAVEANEKNLLAPAQFHTNEECGESCADCLSAQILEESCDSVSSSKLEWVSVRSSFNSSGSDVVEVSHIRMLEDDYPSAENAATGDDTSQYQTCCGKCLESCQKCDVHSSDVSGLSFISDKLPESPDLGKRSVRHNKRLTSSLPNHGKASRRHPRRQSWNSSKDTAYYADWNSLKQPSWLDEGDSSSGNLGDLDSSDNAARCSSVEEGDGKQPKNEHSMGKRLTLWWSSFGKSGKKHRSNKRHSHFYCERQDSSEGDERAFRNSMHEEVTHSCAGVGITQSLPEVSLSCVTLPAAGTSGLEYPVLNYKVTSDESIVSDIHSDSEGENANDSQSVGNKSSVESKCDGKKAFYIANELMTSEQVFINTLKLLNDDFRLAVEKANSHGQPVIPPAEFEKIINSLPQLQRLNEDLLRDLEERIQNWSSIKKIADVIVKKGPFLKLYSTYIQNFEAQCNYFDECCQKYTKFAKVVRDFESSPVCRKLSVKHYMLKPVQRIPQYRLLLDDYFRHLDLSSPDYEDTQTALKIVCDVAEHANRSIKQGDHLSALLQLQSLLGNFEIIKPGRILLKEGELHKLSRKERQPRYFILLNDCLLYTSYYGSGPSSGLKVNTELPLGGMKVTIPQAEDYHNEFSIISSTRSFILSARSSYERQEWVEALQNAIQEYTSRQLSFQVQKLNVSRTDGSSEPFKLGKQAPIWIQDGRVTKCQSCVAEFTVTFRRHHCRACGKVVCGMCSAFRAPLQYMKFQADRVCEDCYLTLLREFESSGNKISEIIRMELGRRKLDHNVIESIRSHFKKLGPSSGKKTRKNIPQRLLEVTANDTGSQMCGWLQRRTKRSWKKLWFVLKEQVLYVYKASEDVVALESIPVLGYKVEPMKQNHFQLYEGVDAKLVFQLAHPNQQPLVFSAESENLVNRWIAELRDSTVLK